MTALHHGHSRSAPEPDPEPRPGRLVVDASRSALSPHLRRRPVAVSVDGLPLRLPWGRTAVDLPAGRHLVEIEVEHRRGWGPVVDAVPVAAGHTVEVFYRAPALPRLGGSLGPAPQRTRGRCALAVAVGALAVLVLVAVLVAMFAVVGLLG